MLLQIKQLLPPQALAQCLSLIHDAPWCSSNLTAGTQSASVKNNQQLPPDAPQLPALQQLLMEYIQKNGLLFSATLPRRVFPPLFNRYSGTTNAFGNHIDNAIRTVAGTAQHMRTDVSCTVFLTDPAEYDGGALIIEDTYGQQAVKLSAGDAILYPAGSVHRVEPVTRGTRTACFFWIESMVRDDAARRILFDMDVAILDLRQSVGDTAAVVGLTGAYHNLLRLWAVP